MSIMEVTGDIFACQAQALVNPVNCVGTMSKGLARSFQRRFPGNTEAYVKACRHREVRPGRMFIWFDSIRKAEGQSHWMVVNFPTKRHWSDGSRRADILTGLRDLRQVIGIHRLRSIAIPALGCGLGGLDWTVIRQDIREALSHVDGGRLDVWLYGPRES